MYRMWYCSVRGVYEKKGRNPGREGGLFVKGRRRPLTNMQSPPGALGGRNNVACRSNYVHYVCVTHDVYNQGPLPRGYVSSNYSFRLNIVHFVDPARFGSLLLHYFMRDSVFDRLVSELSREQRQDMLEKLKSTVSDSGSLANDEEDVGEHYDSTDVAERIKKLGLFARFWLLIRSMFNGRPQEDILESDLLSQTAKRIGTQAPDILDPGTRQAKPGLYKRLRTLEQATRTCFEILGPATGEQKGAFLAFLLERESEEVRLRLESDMDIDRLADENPSYGDLELKRLLESNLAEIIDSMPSSVRTRMYAHAQFLDHFRRLGTFDFASVFALFHPSHGTEVENVDLALLQPSLEQLAAIGKGLRVTPGECLLESLYLFVRQEASQNESERSDEELSYRLERFGEGFREVRDFFTGTPVEALARLAVNSVHFQPETRGGGEDWFARLKQFWTGRIDGLYHSFAFERKERKLLDEATTLCGVPVEPLSAFETEIPGERSRFASLLGVVDSFLKLVFRPSLYPPLRTLQTKGDFYKGENRTEFNEAFETLRAATNRLKQLQTDVATDGVFGQRLQEIVGQGYSPDRVVELRKPVIDEVNQNAQSLVSDVVTALRSLDNVLNGMLYGEVGGSYDTLSNLSNIEGRDTDKYLRKLDNVLTTLRSAEQLIARGLDLATMDRP